MSFDCCVAFSFRFDTNLVRTKSHDPLTIKSKINRLQVTEAEAELFKTKAKEAGCKTLSEYIRIRCIDGTMDTNAVRQE